MVVLCIGFIVHYQLSENNKLVTVHHIKKFPSCEVLGSHGGDNEEN
jgi:hypothetical protein